MGNLESNQDNNIKVETDTINLKEENPICNFWMRILALMIDVVLLTLFANIIGVIFCKYLALMNGWELLIGFICSLIYFGILNSKLGNGQTPGKFLTRIKVVNKQGNPIDVKRSSLRASILLVPYFLCRIKIPSLLFDVPLRVIFGSIVYLGLFGYFFFYVFNRSTRQSIHDLIVNTYVVKKRFKGVFTFGKISKVHYFVFIVITICFLGGSYIFNGILLNKTEFPELVNLSKDLSNMENVLPTNVQTITIFTENGPVQALKVTVIWRGDFYPDTLISAGNRIAKHIIESYPNIEKKDNLWLSVNYGYDIGLASGYFKKINFSTIAEWRKEIKK